MKENGTFDPESEIRLKRIAAESEKQQEAQVRNWLRLAEQLLDSDAAKQPETLTFTPKREDDEAIEEKIPA